MKPKTKPFNLILVLIASVCLLFSPNIAYAHFAQEANLLHDASSNGYDSLIQVDSDTFALAYTGMGNDGYIKTFDISADNTIINEIDELMHDSSNVSFNSLVMLDSDTFVLAYAGANNDGFIKTFNIATNGTITEMEVLEHDLSTGRHNSLVMVDSDTFALAYAGSNFDGYITTFDISADGTTINEINQIEYNMNNGLYNSLVKVDSDTFALAYYDTGIGVIQTFDISADGMTITGLTQIEYDGVNGKYNSLIQIDSDIFALAYTGADDDGFISTFNISADGLTIIELTELEHDTGNGEYNSLVKLDTNTVALAYTSTGSNGVITSFTIPSNGTSITKGLQLEHETLIANYNSIVMVDSDTLALAYTDDSNNNGYLATFDYHESFPTVTSVTSDDTMNGVYGMNSTIPISVNFSEIMIVTGTPQLILETGTTDRSIDYVTGNGTVTFEFDYIVLTGDTTTSLDYVNSTSLILNGGTITNTHLNATDLLLPVPNTENSLSNNTDINIDTNSEISLDDSAPNFIFDFGSLLPSMLSYSSGNATMIIDSLLLTNDSFLIPTALDILASNMEGGDVLIEISADSTFTAETNFSGMINLPESFGGNCNSFTSSISMDSIMSCMSVGQIGMNIFSDKPIRILFEDQEVYSPYYINTDAEGFEITKSCNADSGDILDEFTNDLCFLRTSSGLVIWTNHFTDFGSFNDDDDDDTNSYSSGIDSILVEQELKKLEIQTDSIEEKEEQIMKATIIEQLKNLSNESLVNLSNSLSVKSDIKSDIAIDSDKLNTLASKLLSKVREQLQETTPTTSEPTPKIIKDKELQEIIEIVIMKLKDSPNNDDFDNQIDITIQETLKYLEDKKREITNTFNDIFNMFKNIGK